MNDRLEGVRVRLDSEAGLISSNSFLSYIEDPPRKWPDPLESAAYHGLIGEILRAIEPETEADPAAIVLQVLVAFGALVGRGPHVRVEGDEHHLNLFALLAGDTSKARKGNVLEPGAGDFLAAHAHQGELQGLDLLAPRGQRALERRGLEVQRP